MQTDWISAALGVWSAELGLPAILLRIVLSVAFTAIIGCERSSKRHSAGLRTFILVGLAGTGTMLLDQSLMQSTGGTVPVLSAAAVIGTATISGNSILFSSKTRSRDLPRLWDSGAVQLSAWRSVRDAIPLRLHCLPHCWPACPECQYWRNI